MHVRDHLGACFAVAKVHRDINCCYVMFLSHLCHVISFSSFVRMMQMTCPRVRLAMLYMLYVLGCMIDLFLPCLSSLQSAMWLWCCFTCYEMPSCWAHCYRCVYLHEACLCVSESPSCVLWCGAYHLPCLVSRWLKLALLDAMMKLLF